MFHLCHLKRLDHKAKSVLDHRLTGALTAFVPHIVIGTDQLFWKRRVAIQISILKDHQNKLIKSLRYIIT